MTTMAAGFGRVVGWGLPALIIGTLLGAFSTTLNGLQTLNGLFCFDTVLSESRLEEAAVSSFVVSGYGRNHYYESTRACGNITLFLNSEPYPFCTQWRATDIWGLTSEGVNCEESTKGTGVIESYSYALNVNCTSGQTLFQSFMVSLTPGSSSMTGAGNITGYYTVATVYTNRCALSQYFYIVFSSACAAITMIIFLVRAWMRTCLVGFSFRLSQSETFYWVYKELEKQGFFDFDNPYQNEPYHLVKGEKFYVMRDRSSSISSGDKGSCSYPADWDTDIDMSSVAWSSAHSVYKFTYVDGKVFAYCKDRSEFETFVAANVEWSAASVIKEYLKQKSRSACVTNDAKSHFLSLTECCELAQEGYELVEEISDRNYRMFYRSPRTQSHRPAQTA